MISCKKAAALSSEALDRRLTIRERLVLRVHLVLCRVCRSYERQLMLVRAAASRLEDLLAEGEHLDPIARERIRERVRAER